MSKNTWHAWFDGATKQTNPGIRGIGGVLKGPAGERIEVCDEIGMGTNNEAEYAALMAILDAAITAKAPALVVHGDSQLVIKQVNGEWFIKAKELVPMCKTVLELKAQIPSVILRWIPREENTEADALSKKALGVIDKDAIDKAVWMKITSATTTTGIASCCQLPCGKQCCSTERNRPHSGADSHQQWLRRNRHRAATAQTRQSPIESPCPDGAGRARQSTAP